MPPPDKKYISNVYATLKESIDGFNKTPEEFEHLVSTDKDYRSKVYSTIKDNIEGFDKTPEQFDGAIYTPDPPSPKPQPDNLQDHYHQQGFLIDQLVPKEKQTRVAGDIQSLPNTKPLSDNMQDKSVQQEGEGRTAATKQLRTDAVINTVKRKHKNLGIPIDENSRTFKNDVDLTKKALENGDIVLHPDKEGNIATTRPEGFKESLKNTLINSIKAPIEAFKVNKISDPKELADRFDSENAMQPDVPESVPSGVAGKLGEYVGGAIKPAALLSLNALSGGIGGTSAFAAETAMTALAQTRRELYNKYKDQFQNEGLPEGEARVKAAQHAIDKAPLAALPEQLTNLALVHGLKHGEVSPEYVYQNPATKAFVKTVQNYAKGTAKMGATGGAMTAAKLGIEKAQGLDVKGNDALNEVTGSIGDWGAMHASMEIMLKPKAFPKAVISAAKEVLHNTPPEVLSASLSSMPEGESIVNKLESYAKARDKVSVAPEETIPHLAGLAEKQNNIHEEIKKLEESKKNIHPALHEPVNEEIKSLKEKSDAINGQMEKMAKSPNPVIHEVDELTGERSKDIPDETTPQKEENTPDQSRQGTDMAENMPGVEDNANQISSPINTENEKAKADAQAEGKVEQSKGAADAAPLTPEQKATDHAEATSVGYDNVHEALGSVNKHLGTDYTHFADIPKEDLVKAKELSDKAKEDAVKETIPQKVIDKFDRFPTADKWNFLNVGGEIWRKNNETGEIISQGKQGEFTMPKDNSGQTIDEATAPKEAIAPDPQFPDYTGIKNRIVDTEREAAGKAPINTATGKPLEQQFNETKAKIDKGEIPVEHIRDLSHAIATGNKDFVSNLSLREMQHALLHDKNTLKVEGRDIYDKLIEAQKTKDEAAIANLKFKQAQNDILMEENNLATKKTGTELSFAFAARKLEIKDDYSLAELTRKYKAAGDGNITPEVKDRLRELSQKIEEKDATLTIMENAAKEADAEIENLKKINEELKASKGKEKSQNKAFDDLKKETFEKRKAGRTRAKVEIEKERNVIKQNIKATWKQYSKGQLNAGIPLPVEMIPDLVKLAKTYIEDGIVTLSGVIDKVHEDVSEYIDGIDKTTIRDAITGYGKIKKTNDDPIDKTFRDLTAQGRLVSSIEMANEGQPPLRSGQQRDKPTAEQRRLNKELNKAIKDNNIQVTNPEQQLKTSLDAVKTRFNNEIEELTNAIADNEKIVRDKSGIQYDEEANKLKAERDAKKQEYEDIFGKNELTDEERIDRSAKSIERSIEKLKEKINTKDFSKEVSKTPESERLTKLSEQKKELSKEFNDLMEAEGELYKRKLEALKKNVAKRTDYLNEIKRTGNLDRFIAERVRKKTTPDAELIKARAIRENLKHEVDGMLKQREFNNLSSFQKGLHWGNRLAKGVLISNPVTLAKIAGSVMWRGAYKAPTEVIKYGLSKALPGLAKGAHTEAIRTRKDLADHLITYYTTLFSKENMQGFKFAFKNHETSEGLAFGKEHYNEPIPKIKVTNVKTAIQASFFKTLEVLDKNASAHGALKSLVSKPEFEAYRKTILRNLISEGVTPEEMGQPTLMEAANQLAFQKSLRAKFMQENIATGLQKKVEGLLREQFKRPDIAEVISGVLPLTKIASNYIAEGITKLPVVGLAKDVNKVFAYAMGNGSKLTETQKSTLLRTLTFQGVGMFTYALGFMMHNHFLPSYNSSANKYAKKKQEDDQDSAGEVLFHTFSHSPDALIMQAGAAHAWVWDKYKEEHPEEADMGQFILNSGLAAKENTYNVLSSSPYLQTDKTVVQPLLTGRGIGKAAANFVKSRTPFATSLEEVAQGKIPVLNKLGIKSGHEEKIKPSEIGVFPKTFMDNIGMGVPGWRDKIVNRLFEKEHSPKHRNPPDLHKQELIRQKMEELHPAE
jgi:hypothetical protein